MRAIGYFRVIDTTEGSPQQMTESLAAYCIENKHKLIETFSDTAETFDKVDNNFEQMLEYVRASGKEFLVLVPDATHLGSDIEGVTRALIRLEHLKAEVLCTAPEYPNPLQSAAGYLGPKNVSRLHSGKIRDAMQEKALQGQGLGRPPYGYRIGHDSKLEVVPEESSIVELIFDMYTAKQMGFRKITEYLNSSGIQNRRNSQWNIITIRDILKNMVYLGTYTRFGVRLHRNHPQIVPTSVFQAAQQLMSNRRPRREWTEVEPFLLSGLVFCGYCGNRMIGVTRRQSWKLKDGSRSRGLYRYYQCQSRTNQSTCQYHTWRAQRLEEEVRSKVQESLDRTNVSLSELLSRVKLPEGEVHVAEKRFTKAFTRAAQGEMSLHVLSKYLDLLDAVRITEGVDSENSSVGDSFTLSKDTWDSLSMHTKQSLLKRLLDRVNVQDEIVTIHLNGQLASPLIESHQNGKI